MEYSAEYLLRDRHVVARLELAWRDSMPGTSHGHEEGGFIILNTLGSLEVIRWPRGEKDQITVPEHPLCRIGKLEIVASFHTHPNIVSHFIQEPSETDRRAVSDDSDLKGTQYVGENVISEAWIYWISRDGVVLKVAETRNLFSWS